MQVTDQVRELQRIFLGKESESVDCHLYAVNGSELVDPVPGLLFLGEEGLLVVCEQPFTSVRDDMQTWPGEGVFFGEWFAFCNWDADLTRISPDDPDDEEEPAEILIADQDYRDFTILVDREFGEALCPLDDDHWDELSDAVTGVLAEIGFADRPTIVSMLEEKGWNGIDTDDVGRVLNEPEHPARYIPHAWFFVPDTDLAEDPDDELAAAVLQHLKAEAPQRVGEIFEALQELNLSIDFDEEDIVDVLYDPELPTLKMREAWFLDVSIEATS